MSSIDWSALAAIPRPDEDPERMRARHRVECRRMIEQLIPGVRTADGRVSSDGNKVIKATHGGFYVFDERGPPSKSRRREIRVLVILDGNRVSVEAHGINSFERDLRVDDPPYLEALTAQAQAEAEAYLRRAQLYAEVCDVVSRWHRTTSAIRATSKGEE